MPKTFLGSTTPLNVRRKKGKPLSRARTSRIQAYSWETLAMNHSGATTWGDHLAEPCLLAGGVGLHLHKRKG